MTKEEIALQLTLKKLDDLHPTTYCSASPDKNNANFNEQLGVQIANIYNAVYKNLQLDDTTLV